METKERSAANAAAVDPAKSPRLHELIHDKAAASQPPAEVEPVSDKQDAMDVDNAPSATNVNTDTVPEINEPGKKFR